MVKYLPANQDIAEIVASVRKQHHAASLADAAVAVVLVATAREIALASIRATSPAVRAGGGPDAILAIDAKRWDDSSVPGRVALADHGLATASVRRLPNGVVRIDGAGRPKIARCAPDLPGCGYAEVLRRHKARSVENGRLLLLRDRTAIDPSPASKPRPRPTPPPAV